MSAGDREAEERLAQLEKFARRWDYLFNGGSDGLGFFTKADREVMLELIAWVRRLALAAPAEGRAEVHAAANALLAFMDKSGTWCESAVVAHGSAWHLTADEYNAYEARCETLERTLEARACECWANGEYEACDCGMREACEVAKPAPTATEGREEKDDGAENAHIGLASPRPGEEGK